MKRYATNVLARFAAVVGSLLIGGLGMVGVSLLIPDMMTPHGSSGDWSSIGDYVVLFGTLVYKRPWIGLVALLTILVASAAWEARQK